MRKIKKSGKKKASSKKIGKAYHPVLPELKLFQKIEFRILGMKQDCPQDIGKGLDLPFDSNQQVTLQIPDSGIKDKIYVFDKMNFRIGYVPSEYNPEIIKHMQDRNLICICRILDDYSVIDSSDLYCSAFYVMMAVEFYRNYPNQFIR